MIGKIHVDSVDVITKLEAAVGRFQTEAAESLKQADAGIRHIGERLEEHRKYLNRLLDDREWEVKQAERALCDCLDDEDANCETERDELADAKRAREDVREKIDTMGRLVNRLRVSVSDFVAESKRFSVVKDEVCPRARECLRKYASALVEVNSIVAPESAEAFVASMSSSMIGGGATQMPDGGQGSNGMGEVPSSSAGAARVGFAHRFEINDIERDLFKMLDAIFKENPGYFCRGIIDVFEVDEFSADFYHEAYGYDINSWFMGTDSHGIIFITNNEIRFLNNRNFNPAKQLISALAKIRRGIFLSFEEEYAVECLWHEICHNRAREWRQLPEGDDNPLKVCMEAMNQFVARHTYSDFLMVLGGEARHADKILVGGLAYSKRVNNLRRLIGKLGLEEKKILNDIEQVLLEMPYDEITEHLATSLAKLSGNKKDKILNVVNQLQEGIPDYFEEILKRELS